MRSGHTDNLTQLYTAAEICMVSTDILHLSRRPRVACDKRRRLTAEGSGPTGRMTNI